MTGYVIIKLYNDRFIYLFSTNCIAETVDKGVCQNVAVFQCIFHAISDVCWYRIMYLFSTRIPRVGGVWELQ
jgi:hypothetical protein